MMGNVFKQKPCSNVRLGTVATSQHADIDPKVCESFETAVGRPPRRVQIERLRRRYEAYDIAQLLQERGIDYSDPSFQKNSALPLEPFDDTEFDVRTPKEWLDLGRNPDTGEFLPLVAQALCVEGDVGFWRRALIHDYNEALELFEVHWDAGGLEGRPVENLPRLHVLFSAEDPVVFADRSAAAHAARRAAEAMVRYNFFIDNMPTDDVQTLDSVQAERLLESVPSKEEAGEVCDANAILAEIQLDYARTMNRVVFDLHLLEKADGDSMHADLHEVARRGPVAGALLRGSSGAWTASAPQYGLFQIPHHPFAETFASFCLSTLRVRPEVVLALHGIRAACEKAVKEESVFCTHFKNVLRLEEFRVAQRSQLSQTVFQLKDLWTASLHQTVLREFSSVGKGWFNINETSIDQYKRGKLRRFLALVRLIMQDTLWEIAEFSINAYVDEVDARVPREVHVKSLSFAQCSYRTPSIATAAAANTTYAHGADANAIVPPPLFSVEVIRREPQDGHSQSRSFGLATEAPRFVSAAVEAFDAGLAALNEIPPLERLVLPNLAKAQASLPLSIVDAREPFVMIARGRLERLLNSALPSLEQYLLLLREYEGLLNRDAVAHVSALERREPPPDDSQVQEAIAAEVAAQEELLRTLPEVSQVGLFQVGCKDVRRTLAGKYEQAAQLLLELLVARLRTQMGETLDAFHCIGTWLRRSPKSVEELVEMRRFADGVPRQVQGLREKIARDVALFERLEGLFYKLHPDDIRRRWNLAAAPRAAIELMCKALKTLQHEEAEFTKQMVSQQAEFRVTLDDIDNIIDLFRFKHEYRDIKLYVSIAEVVENVNERLKAAAQQAKLFNSREALLGRRQTDYSRVQETERNFEIYSALWTSVMSWLSNREKWRDGSLLGVDAAYLEAEVLTSSQNIAKVARILQEEGQQEDILQIAMDIQRELDEFKPCVPLIVALRTEGMSERHWNEISQLVGRTVVPDMPDFILSKLISGSYNLLDHFESVQATADRAAKEFGIERRLKSMQSGWDYVSFDCGDQYRGTGTYVLKGVEAVVTLLDEQLVGAQSLQFSCFKGDLTEEIDSWVVRLRYMSDHLEEWHRCQRSWLYLQPVFDSADVMRQLPAESRRFKSVDSLWRSVMKLAHDNPHAFTCLTREGVMERWVEANQSLETVQRSLEEYLETKRTKFSRFYFLSNDELLEIISQTKDPTSVQPFLRKVFENMGRLAFHDDLSISAMNSLDGEEVRFVQKVLARDANVEMWMGEVEAEMFAAVRAVVGFAIAEYPKKERCAWMMEHPAQAVLSGSQVHWTADVETALSGGPDGRKDPRLACRTYANRLDHQLLDTVAQMRSLVSGRRATMLCALIVLDVHQKDIVCGLASAGASSVTAFEWLSKMRCTWGDGGCNPHSHADAPDLCVKCMQTEFPYGYEYLGNTSRLVVTPLTDQCYVTLLSAQLLNLGGALVGPAGTGKTETIKDLSRAVAKRCIVFNCSKGMNYIMVGRFLKGLAVSGLWCCFDEFNRIEVEVLSVVAQQLLMLFSVKSELLNWFATRALDFEGALIAVSRTFNVFVTMNPSYTGRTELPDNLKAHFRPIAMMIPEYSLIAEILLYSFGFESARDLARKVVVTFRLASEQLSSQKHYDYGMRAVRTVIDASGRYKKAADGVGHRDSGMVVVPSLSSLVGNTAGVVSAGVAVQPGDGNDHTTVDGALGALAGQQSSAQEQQMLLLALQDVSVPKFLEDDLPLFADIIRDIFPSSQIPVVDYSMLEAQISKSCEALSLQPAASFTAKVLQLHGTIQVRHGLMLLGPAGGGKTSCYRTLQSALSSLATAAGPFDCKKVKLHVLNPKSVTLGELYGEFDQDTYEWQDGILAERVRSAARNNTGEEHHWVMLDGPVDVVWVESLNSVLDDNRRLCLNSSEVIQLTQGITMLFEAEDLQAASPATVSRCGMVYMESSVVGVGPLVAIWLSLLPPSMEEHVARFQQLCAELLVPLLTLVHGPDIIEIMETTGVGLCRSFLRLLDRLLGVLCSSSEHAGKKQSLAAASELKSHVDQLFLFALVWSVGASCDADSRMRFGICMRHLAFKVGINVNAIDAGGAVHDRCYKIDSGTWVEWAETTPSFHIKNDSHVCYDAVVVPTIDSVRMTNFLSHLVLSGRHVLCPGPSGTGKSTIISGFLQCDAPSDFFPAHINLSAFTRAKDMRHFVETKLEKRRRGVYGPPIGSKCVVFVDDLNMPRKEEYGAQPPLELLRQWFDHGGWYRRDVFMFCQVIDIVMVAAMGLQGGGRQPVSKRLTRHYHCLAMPELKDSSVQMIFGTLAEHFCGSLPAPALAHLSQIAPATTEVFAALRKELLPTPRKTHYLFNIRDFWRIFQGICSLDAHAVQSGDQLVRAWVHECLRVIGDRFVCTEDHDWLKVELLGRCLTNFGVQRHDIFFRERLIFSCIGSGGEQVMRHYCEVRDLDEFQILLDEQVRYYNEEAPGAPLQLATFLDACDHIARTSRVLRQPGGNSLLIGVGGSGRQSVARLASFIMGCDCYKIEGVTGYSFNEWRKDVKTCLLKAGLHAKDQSLLLCDRQIFSECVVEDVNCILNSADLLNLYSVEDMEAIVQECTPDCHKRKLEVTKQNIFNVYVDRVKRHLHIVLAFSPSSSTFRARLRMFPALVNCCTMDWFFEWPPDALLHVAEQRVPSAESLDMEYLARQAVLHALPRMHACACMTTQRFRSGTHRHCETTPAAYLEMLRLFEAILGRLQAENRQRQGHFQMGVDKLEDARTQVEIMKDNLQEITPQLETTRAEVAAMMSKLKRDRADADLIRDWVQREECEAKSMAEACQIEETDAERDLSSALPALESACECLMKLQANHLREVKTMIKPPSGVVLVMSAVCIMLGVPPVRKPCAKPGTKIDDYWEAAHGQILKDPRKLLDDLLNYDKDSIGEETMKKIQPYIEREDFEPSQIRKSSVACEAMCLWVRAMCKYHEISKAVQPKREKLNEAQFELGRTQGALKTAQERFAGAAKVVTQLEDEFAILVARQDSLVAEISDCEAKIERAQRLMKGLGGETARWADLARSLASHYTLLVGDALFCSCMITFSGPFDAEYRRLLVQAIIKNLEDTGLGHTAAAQGLQVNLQLLLGDPPLIREWQMCGLPDDTFSIENGIIMDVACRWPLMIDPQKQANLFARNLGKAGKCESLEVVKQSDRAFSRALELALQLGRWLLIEQFGEVLDPGLEPVLQRRKKKVDGDWCVKIVDKVVPWNLAFRLLMTTLLPNPDFAPELQAQVTVVNFAITPEGLKEQMLALVVNKENPMLEQRKGELVVLGVQLSKELKEAEDSILQMLSTSEGGILEDEALIDALAAARRTSEAVNEKMEEARAMEGNIDKARHEYTPVAAHSAVLFSVIGDLRHIDPMYQYSLQWFKNLCVLSVDESPQAGRCHEQRLRSLSRSFSYKLYCSASRALFTDHKLLFSLSLCIRVVQSEGKIDPRELRFFLTGSAATVQAPPTNPTNFLAQDEWDALVALGRLAAFMGIEVSFDVLHDEWAAFCRTAHPEEEKLPGSWEHRLSCFQRLCLLRAIRLDCAERAIAAFVEGELGQAFVDPPTFSLALCFEDATNITPLVFILSGGADPVSEIIALAREKLMDDRFETISLGQGQGAKAKRLIEEAATNGSWVLLCNCHLDVYWMPELEQLCEDFHPELTHRDFRLWLTSKPTSSFPASILQGSVKMTNAPPRGLRANLLQIYGGLDNNPIDGCSPAMASVHRRLTFGLSFFHAVVMERLHLGPIGFNVPYTFTFEDFSASRRQLLLLLGQAEAEAVPYDAMVYVTSAIHYGGRITDDQDKRLIDSIVRRYLCKELVEDRNYKLSACGTYGCPHGVRADEFVDFIQKLPINAPLEVFSMHENARISSQRQGASTLLGNLLQMNSRIGKLGVADDSLGDHDALLQQVQLLITHTPDEFDVAVVRTKWPPSYTEGMNTVLLQEVLRYNKLLRMMTSTLKRLENALRGLVVVSEELELLGESIHVGVVPEAWADVGFLSLKPLASWVNDLGDRVKFFVRWAMEEGQPMVFWAGGFVFPQGFLSCILQRYARHNAMPIDRLTFKHEVLEFTDPEDCSLEAVSRGCLLHGFYLEGCRWDSVNRYLAPSKPLALFSSLPVVWFLPVADHRCDGGARAYRAPLYKTLSRRGTLSTTGHSTNYVASVDLPSVDEQEVWILAGVALFLSLST